MQIHEVDDTKKKAYEAILARLRWKAIPDDPPATPNHNSEPILDLNTLLDMVRDWPGQTVIELLTNLSTEALTELEREELRQFMVKVLAAEFIKSDKGYFQDLFEFYQQIFPGRSNI